jgi:hypothetical protein
MPKKGLMQHYEARFAPQVGHDIFVVHVSWNDQYRWSKASQSSGDGRGLLSLAAVMKVAAKNDEIGINIFQIIKPLDVVMQIGKTQNSQRFHDFAISFSTLILEWHFSYCRYMAS